MTEIKWMGDKVKEKIEKRLASRLKKAVRNVSKETAAQLPKDTGRLADSVDYISEGLEASWGTEVEYASDLEFGTRDKGPDGTWRRVLEQKKQEMKETLKGK